MTEAKIAAFGESSGSHSSFHDISSVCLEPVDEEAYFDQCFISGMISPVSLTNFGTSRSNPGFARRSLAGFRVSSLPANNHAAGWKMCCKHADLEKSSLSVREDVDKENIVEETISVEETEKGLQGLGRKAGNRAIRKLFYDELDVEKTHSSNDKMTDSGKEEVSSTVDCDYSQEPSGLSQANALEFVDAFLSLNDLGSSQDVCLGNGNLGEIKNSPVSGLKGAQCLARTFSKSPIGKCGVFDFEYSREDEGGGDFFTRRKGCIFSDSKSSIKPRRRALHKSVMKEDPFENGKDKASTQLRSLRKINILSKTATKNERFKVINLQNGSEPAINVNCPNQSMATKKGSLRHVIQQRRVSSVGGTRSSNKLMLSATKFSGTLMSSYKRKLRSSKLRYDEVSMAMVEPIDEISKGRDNLRVLNSLNECTPLDGIILSNSREKMVNGGKPLDKDKEFLHAGIRSTPVAQWTRQSRAEESSKKTDALLNTDTDKMKYQQNGHSIQDRENSFEKNPISNKRLETQVDEGSNPAKRRTRSGVRVVTSCQPKRRRAHLNYAKDVDNVANPEFECELQRSKASFSAVDGQTKATMKSTLVIQGNPKLEALRKEEIQPVEMPFSSPLNKINAVSPVRIDVNSMQISNNKCSSMPAVAKDLNRLKPSVATSTSALKKTRRKKDLTTIRAFFSCHLNDDIIKKQEKILARFEITVASSISEATHFIADKFSRTRNMLEAMAVGKPVVTHLWLESCGRAGCYTDEEKYILRDLKKEKEIGFIMPDSLACSMERGLLQDKRVFITKNVKPDRKTILNLVVASGGQPIERFVRSTANDKSKLLVISCEEDYTICIPVLEKGLEVFTSELVMNGIVIQKLEYERHCLTTRLRNLIGNQFLPVTKLK